MRIISALSLSALLLLNPVVGAAGEPVQEPLLSFQGFTGILNTPNARVNREGSLHLLYSNQRENIWRNDPRKDRQKIQDNYLLSVGLFSFFELGGRLTEAPGRGRDLSASFKASTASLTDGLAYWPVLAAGIQDIGGGVNQLQSRYAVISEELWRFRLSAGYGFQSGRMKGGFGGVEFRAHDWVTLLGEYDTRDTSAGIRLLTPELWRTPFQLTATLKSTLNHKPGSIDVAFGLTFPLDLQKRAGRAQDGTAAGPAPAGPPQTPQPPPLTTPDSAPSAASRQSVPAARAGALVTNIVTPETREILSTLQKQLVAAGFINVRTGQRHTSELVVEYENTIFNHNELDALGVVAGIVSEAATEPFGTIHIVIRRKGLRVAVVSAPVSVLRAFMKPAGDIRALKESVSFTYDAGITKDTYYLPQESGFPFPNTSLILGPGLQTFVGTEVGLFDYLLSFRPEIISNLWKGGVLQVRWDIPLAWSGNFDDRKPYRNSRNDPRLDRAMLFQGVNLAPGLLANLGAGQLFHNIYGTLNEIAWSPDTGTHRLRAVQALARDQDTRRRMEVYLGSYRYLYAPLDLSLELTGGRYWGQDRGFSIELKRFFGDSAVSTYYKNTTTAEGKHWQAAGIQFVLPLTPRKDLKVGPFQIRGADEWGYAQETTLAIGGQKTNDVLSQSLAINPLPTPALYRSYYNRDRLGAAYLEQHLDRLREAWLKYRTTVFH